MRILITGHKGLIGKTLHKTLEKEHEIIGIDSYNTTVEELNKVYEKLSQKNPDVIIHCASHCIIREVIKNPNLAFENVQNHFSIYEIARESGCKKIVYFSSSRVGHDTSNPYTASKVFGEELAKGYKQCYDIDTLIIRPETVWNLSDRHKRVIPNWILNAIENKDIIVYGDENKQLPPVHVDSFIDAFLCLFYLFIRDDAEIENKPWLISGKTRTAKEITDIIKKVTKSTSKVIYKEQETSQPQLCNKADIEIDDFEESIKKELEVLQ